MNIKIILIICLFAPFLAQASDLAKEQRWKEKLIADLFDGEAISLNDGEIDFLALITAAGLPRPNAVIIMHGIGVHPDWPQIINPLRVGLAEQGWLTLSIQLPVLDNEASAQEYDEIIHEAGPRIRAAMDLLRDEGAQGVYIVAHSMGARMASAFLAKHDENVRGFVGIGMNRGTSAYLGEMNLPMLDLYGSEDLEGVLASAKNRAEAAANNPYYRQQIVQGADHFFNDLELDLLMLVSQWLQATDEISR